MTSNLKLKEANRSLVVVGSCNVDFFSYTPRLPIPGETIHGTNFATAFGGKGANQCVAAAKLGAHTHLVGRVGDDVWGDKYLDNLKTQGVDTTYVQKTESTSTGIAQIIVAENGQNQIVVIAGANNFLSLDDLEKAKSVISAANVVVLQLESPVETVIKALELCRGISILNAAPALATYDTRLLTLPTIFCVNEVEASMFSGLPVHTPKEAEKAGRDLIAKGCNNVLLTLGSHGAVYVEHNQKEVLHVPAPHVKTVDTTGAGDAFIGALAYLLTYNKDMPMRKILKCSCTIAADCVTRPGAQPSFPGKDILKRCLS